MCQCISLIFLHFIFIFTFTDRVHGLSVIIIADWYDELVLHKEIYKDDNTRSTWHPITGGSNIPAINRLLDRFDAQICLQSFKGKFNFSGSEVRHDRLACY